MVKFYILVISYVDNTLRYLTLRGVNVELSEDHKIIIIDGIGTRLEDQVRSLHEPKLNMAENNLMYKCTKLYITVSLPGLSDHHYAVVNDAVEINLDSTAKAVHQMLKFCFPRSVNPMVILKLFYVTKQI